MFHSSRFIAGFLLFSVGLPAVANDDRVALREVLSAVESHYFRSVDVDRLSAVAIGKVLSQLDPHCQWFPPKEADRLRDAAHGLGRQPRRPTVRGRRPPDIEDWIDWCDGPSRIGYLRIDAFGADTAREMRAALFRLAEANVVALVLDLQFNRGGLLSAGIDVADIFLAKGQIVRIVRRNGSHQTVLASRDGAPFDLPMVVLVNRETASTSEVVAAALQDAGRATIAGERTIGKGSLQDLIDLPSGGILKLTTAMLQRPRGTSLDRQTALDAGDWGIAPDAGVEIRLSNEEHQALADRWVAVDEATAAIETIQDRQLDRALQFLRSR